MSLIRPNKIYQYHFKIKRTIDPFNLICLQKKKGKVVESSILIKIEENK